MKFEELLPFLRKGLRVRRTSWDPQGFVQLNADSDTLIDETATEWHPQIQQLLEDDWEVIEEKRELSWRQILQAWQSSASYSYQDARAVKRKLGFTED